MVCFGGRVHGVKTLEGRESYLLGCFLKRHIFVAKILRNVWRCGEAVPAQGFHHLLLYGLYTPRIVVQHLTRQPRHGSHGDGLCLQYEPKSPPWRIWPGQLADSPVMAGTAFALYTRIHRVGIHGQDHQAGRQN